MTAREWERIKTLFDAALNLDAERRSAYLEDACADCPDIQSTLQELLRNFDEAGTFLEDYSAPSNVPAFTPHQVIAGRFHVIRQIAAGGMGEVYEVFDDRLGLRVALKTIRTDLAASRDAYERFKREVWIAREVPHEGICRVFELIEHIDPSATPLGVIPCITMKLLEGHDLRAELRRRRPLPLSEAFSITGQICDALQSLHDHGIIHRDLKPSNIMLVPGHKDGPKVVLTDFGLARRVDQTTRTHSAADQHPGAPYFQAPEILKGERETTASDIYALGLVIDEMVTDTPAFTAESVHAVYWQKLWEKPIPPSKRAVGLPPAWERAILKCLSSNSSDRYLSPADLRRDLITSVTEDARPRRLPRALSGSVFGRTPRRRLLLWTAMSTVAACAAVPTLIWSTTAIPVLVYPVANETGNAELDYLSKGLSGELLRRLSRIKALQIFPVREEGMGKRQAGIRPRYKLQARLSRSGDRLWLSAELRDLIHQRVEWTRQWEQELRNPLTVESQIAEGVVSALEARFPAANRILGGGTVLALPQAATRNSAAYQSYLRGQVLLEDRTVKSAVQAMIFFRQAIAEDANFALAWAAMADAQRVLMEFDYGQRGQVLPQAREFAEKAVAIDPDSPEAQATLGAVMQILWEWERADAAYKRAVALHPRYARGHRWYGGMLLQFGRIDEGLQRVRLALELDPFDYMSQSAYGFCLFYAGRPVEAMKHLESLLEERESISAHINLGMVYAKLAGEATGPEALQLESKALREAAILHDRESRGRDPLSSDYPLKWSPFVYALTYAYRGRPDLAQPWLEQLEAGRKVGLISPVTVAAIHAALKEDDRALDLLEMAAAYHERELTNLKISPFFRGLRDHPRFQSLLRSMGLKG
jgi:serine/threonine-protein kinase